MARLFRLRALGWAAFFSVLACLPFFTTAHQGEQFYFQVDAASDQSGLVQLFFDVGRGFNQNDSAMLPITANAPRTRLKFPLPAGSIRAMRFDPLDQAGTVFVASPRIVSSLGTVLRRIAPEQIRPVAEIASATLQGKGVTLRTTEAALDSSCEITGGPFLVQPRVQSALRVCVKPFALSFAIFWLITAVPFARLGRSPFSGIATWSTRHPRTAIAVLSVLVVTIQCYPVIFFGRSFVSPNNGTYLLYDSMPALPGYEDGEIENGRGSDVGALMWWHLYCPVIAHDALFRDRELPLWNRYSMSGVPLLGQGQSMFGDPLNWLSILSRSAAWSWDARFVISRWLLCCGLGLAALALTSSLRAGLLVAIAGGFFGFFCFRVNHPANFSLAYSPWLLVAWASLIRAVTWKGVLRGCLTLAAANFCVMTSGTIKEAYMLMACLNFAGLLLLALHPSPRAQRLRALGLAVITGATFVLVTAPLWLSFLVTLRESWTSYDHATVQQTSPRLLLGAFDDLFTSRALGRDDVWSPASNFLVLFGVLWSLASGRESFRNRAWLALGAASLVPLAFIYGLVPATLITRLPFLANIAHVDNTFLCSWLILSTVLAGFGFEMFFRQLAAHSRWQRYLGFYATLGVLGLLYLTGRTQAVESPFFRGYAWSLLLVIATLPLALRWAWSRADRGLFAAILTATTALVCWRHGQHLQTPFDDYVFNPAARVNLNPSPSPIVAEINRVRTEPSRPIGFELKLFPGYNQMLGWESVLGIDPLRNRYHDELALALGVRRVVWVTQPIVEQDAPAVIAGLDLMNVRYYLASRFAPAHAIPGLNFRGEFDLNLYESPTAWPRAFFTDHVVHYATLPELAALAGAARGRPFAAVAIDSSDSASAPAAPPHSVAVTRSATHYRLTTNRTAFDIDAPKAGMVVLSESYSRDDFQLTVNGRPASYFRVNHAYKGLRLDAPGIYHIEFTYWPRRMTLSLVLSGLGCVGLMIGLCLAFRRPTSTLDKIRGDSDCFT
jgi:hypothetical protein